MWPTNSAARPRGAKLSPGGGLLIYTDGLTEARRRSDRTATGFELFGEERIALLLAASGRLPARRCSSTCADEVREFSGGELADDLCMVALRLTAEPDATEVCSPDRTEIAAVG